LNYICTYSRHTYMKKISCILFLLFMCYAAEAQVPFWAFNIGGISGTPDDDRGQAVKVGPNGNVYVTGHFSGTMDIDPGPGVYNITSNGLLDIFLACYSPTGGFQWGFGIGGGNNDIGVKVDVDPFDNVVICGIYQNSADFDPGVGTAILVSTGGTGSTYLGEGFVAKYSSTGVFQWAKSLGGPTVYDYADALGTDALGCVYVAGEYNGSMTISPTITFSSAATGTGYLIKYDAAGNLVWGHSFGEAGITAVSTGARDLIVGGQYVYLAGHYMGTANFNTWGAPALLTTTGGASDVDGFLAKYDTAGNFVYVRSLGGAGLSDEGSGVRLDAAGNIFISGWTNSANMIFDPTSPGTSTVTAPGGGGNNDFFVARYTNGGAYVWGHVYGNTGDDFNRSGLDLFGSSIYLTGWFNGTVDFNPSATVNNLVSSGLSDIYLARYDLDGNYICAFRVGTAAINDQGYAVGHSATGEIYTTGEFGGTATDFDPSAGTIPLTTHGGTDIYLGKYDVCGSLIAATCDSIGLVDTVKVCTGDTVTLSATIFGTNPLISKIWSPATGLSSTTITNPILTSSSSGYYYFTVRSILPTNLVVNGDFTSGNTGFTSSYTYSPPPSTTLLEGNYSVYTNPFGVHTGFTPMGDHTTGTGNMMIINGGPTPVDVWCQTIAVTPNTDYDFSAWFANCSSVTIPPDVPTLQFRINGVLQGVPTSVTAAPGTWVNFATTWNSGPSTSATICIYDAVTTAAGNDFVIDDITFRSICNIKDSVFVKANLPDTTFNVFKDTICNSELPYTLTPPSGFAAYLWSTGSTTSTTLSATTTGTYWVKASTGCTIVMDTFKLSSFPNPVVNLGNDTGFCIGNTYTLWSPQPAGSTWLWSTGSTGDTIHVSSTGHYVLAVTNSVGCTNKDSVDITVTPPPVVNLGPDTTVCNGAPILLMSSVMYTSPSYFWQNTTTGPTFTATVTGTYWLQVTEYGCSGADTIHVEIKYDTFSLANTDTAICKGGKVQVFATGNAAISFQWLPTSGIAVSNIINPLIIPDTSAMYKLVAHMDGCLDKTDSFYIDVQPNPDPFLGTTRQVCKFDSLHIVSYVDPPWYTHYSYSWTPATALDHPTLPSVTFTADTNTNLVLTVRTPAGCVGKDSVLIVVHPGNFAGISGDTTLCPWDSVQLSATGGVSYKWTPSTYLDDATAAMPWAKPITTQTYTMLATSIYGCHDTLSLSLIVYPAAVMTLEDSVTIYPGESYQISPQTNGTLFTWSPSGGLNGKYISNPLATPEVTTKYVVKAVTEHGCVTKDSILINVDDNALIRVPNAFTPGAGANSKLYIIKRGVVSLKSFRIYNRWGNVVFETTDLDAGWDGTYKGVPQQMDVFVYAIEAVNNKGKVITKTGNITLIR